MLHMQRGLSRALKDACPAPAPSPRPCLAPTPVLLCEGALPPTRAPLHRTFTPNDVALQVGLGVVLGVQRNLRQPGHHREGSRDECEQCGQGVEILKTKLSAPGLVVLTTCAAQAQPVAGSRYQGQVAVCSLLPSLSSAAH